MCVFHVLNCGAAPFLLVATEPVVDDQSGEIGFDFKDEVSWAFVFVREVVQTNGPRWVAFEQLVDTLVE